MNLNALRNFNVIKSHSIIQQISSISFSNTIFKKNNQTIMSKNKGSKKEQQATAAAAYDPLYDSNKAIYLQKTGNICINVLAKPGANETSVTDINDDAVCIRIAAAPVDGEANKELIKYITRLFKLKSGDVYLDTGAKNRNKTLIMENCSLRIEEVLDKLKSEK